MNPIEERGYFKIKTVEARKWPYEIPPGYLYYLNQVEFDLLQDWFNKTDEKQYIGDTDQATLSFIGGLIMSGPSIKRIVQLGTYAGLTAIIIGLLLKKTKNEKRLLASIDIDKKMIEFSQKFIYKSELQNIVRLFGGDSSSPDIANSVLSFLGGEPDMIFIDSAHEYEHTIKELNLWYPLLANYGIILLHDTSEIAQNYDPTKKGGVHKALIDWSNQCDIPICLFSPPVYENPVGLGLITKHLHLK